MNVTAKCNRETDI